jgi:hypothetical protein
MLILGRILKIQTVARLSSLGRLRQEDRVFKTNLSYTERFCLKKLPKQLHHLVIECNPRSLPFFLEIWNGKYRKFYRTKHGRFMSVIPATQEVGRSKSKSVQAKA